MSVKLNITVPYQKETKLCWASIAAALVCFYKSDCCKRSVTDYAKRYCHGVNCDADLDDVLADEWFELEATKFKRRDTFDKFHAGVMHEAMKENHVPVFRVSKGDTVHFLVVT